MFGPFFLFKFRCNVNGFAVLLHKIWLFLVESDIAGKKHHYLKKRNRQSVNYGWRKKVLRFRFVKTDSIILTLLNIKLGLSRKLFKATGNKNIVSRIDYKSLLTSSRTV